MSLIFRIPFSNVLFEPPNLVSIVRIIYEIFFQKIRILRGKAEIQIKTIANKKSYVHLYIHPLCL